jgi:hypothetical protein
MQDVINQIHTIAARQSIENTIAPGGRHPHADLSPTSTLPQLQGVGHDWVHLVAVA